MDQRINDILHVLFQEKGLHLRSIYPKTKYICYTKNRWAKGSSREKCISYGRIPDVVFNRDDSLETLRHILPCDVFSVTCFRDDVSIAISRYIFPPSRYTSVCERWPWGPLTVAHRSVVTLYSFLFTLLC